MANERDKKTNRPPGANGEALMKIWGRISPEAAEEWMRIIVDSCGQIDDEEPPVFPDRTKS